CKRMPLQHFRRKRCSTARYGKREHQRHVRRCFFKRRAFIATTEARTKHERRSIRQNDRRPATCDNRRLLRRPRGKPHNKAPRSRACDAPTSTRARDEGSRDRPPTTGAETNRSDRRSGLEPDCEARIEGTRQLERSQPRPEAALGPRGNLQG